MLQGLFLMDESFLKDRLSSRTGVPEGPAFLKEKARRGVGRRRFPNPENAPGLGKHLTHASGGAPQPQPRQVTETPVRRT
jgi:hypothetical protein